MKNRVVITRKYLVFIFVVMLRALGLQCRIMFNFVALPIKPPSSELCSLSTKSKLDKNNDKQENLEQKKQIKKRSTFAKDTKMKSKSQNISQVDGNEDCMTDSDYEHLMQVDGSNDVLTVKKTRSTRSTRANNSKSNEEDVSPPKRARKDLNTSKVNKKQDDAKSPQKMENTKNNVVVSESISNNIVNINKTSPKSLSLSRRRKPANDNIQNDKSIPESGLKIIEQSVGSRRTRNRINKKVADSDKSAKSNVNTENQLNPPTILITNENQINVPSKYFDNMQQDKEDNKGKPSRKRSNTSESAIVKEIDEKQKDIKSRTKSASGNVIEKSKYFTDDVKKGKLSGKRSNTSESAIVKELDDKQKDIKFKSRTKSAPGNVVEKNKYFIDDLNNTKKPKLITRQSKRNQEISEDKQRVSHRDIAGKIKAKSKNDVTGDLVNIIKNRIKDAKSEAKQGIVKGKLKNESDEDSDHLPIEDPKPKSESEDEFKPTKLSPKPSTSRKIDRRILSTDDESLNKKNDVWCEVFVEELEQWISVDVVQGKVHCNNEIYNRATHPICYIVGWDNNNYLKDLTRRYVPHWNTVTRKLRAEPVWWNTALQPWLGPKTARDKEEDDYLDRMQLEAPLPKSIAEYKNHPLYALKRHLLKFEAIYPPDAATLGFVRGEAVYARRCVCVCRSRDTWLKEAKVVRLGEQPYKVVKARPKWDKLSNKLITDKPLEVFGPWQVQDYEPPVAENGLVPRNAYGNVELFKDCMLPKGTVHIKLPGLNKVARKLNIDCAPAMTGFDFNGGWSHPVYDGFVVCKEFEQVITEAWLEDQKEQERKEREKTELRVYGNWKRLIKGLLIRERLKLKYGFEEPSTSQTNIKKSKGPRLVVKKKS